MNWTNSTQVPCLPLAAISCHTWPFFPPCTRQVHAVSHPVPTPQQPSPWTLGVGLPALDYLGRVLFFFLQEGLGQFPERGAAGRCSDLCSMFWIRYCGAPDWHLWRCPQTQCLVPRFCLQIKLRAEHSNEATIKENCLRRFKLLCWGGIFRKQDLEISSLPLTSREGAEGTQGRLAGKDRDSEVWWESSNGDGREVR